MSVKNLARYMVEFYEKLSGWEHEAVRGSGLSPGQMHAVEILGHETSLRMKELAGKLGVTTGTLTVTVDRLERMGLLIRKPHETDRRSYRVVLTDSGRGLFFEHHALHLKLTEEIVSILSPEEQIAFEKVLEKILKHF